MTLFGYGPIGRPSVWKAVSGSWVVEYWVKQTMHESWHETWADALAFALAQASA